MRRVLQVLVLLAIGTVAHAERGTIAGVKCNHETDRLIVYHLMAYSFDRSALIANERSIGSLLVMKDPDHIGELLTFTRKCKLSHGNYRISLTPFPGNMNVQGRCGGWLSAWVTIWRDDNLLDRLFFDTPCDADDGEIELKTVTRIVVDRENPALKITEVRSEDFYKRDD